MNIQQVATEIVRMLESMLLRPTAYASSPEEAGALLHGIDMVWMAAGVPYDFIREEIITEHGWEINSRGLIWQMREKSMDEQEIIKELVHIAIETLKRRHNLGEVKLFDD